MLRQCLSGINVGIRSITKIKNVTSPTFVNNFCAVHLKKMEGVNTLQQLGYGFNAEGKLRKLTADGVPGDEPFQFNISDKHQECQAHYEEIGDAVTQYVYQLLDQENLDRLPVPVDGKPEESTFIFASKDYADKDTLLILIHGSGVVRAGQWARSIIINECLEMGTQIPYIKKAVGNGYGVLVMNTNDNFGQDGQEIKSSSTPEKHGAYVWENYISKTKAKNILIVAHSYGGVVTVALGGNKNVRDDFETRVKAIGFTDSVHGFAKKDVADFFKQVARNWVTSLDPLDTPVKGPVTDVDRVSAGHKKHEMTSYSCIESVFKFFDEKLSSK